MKSNWRSCGWLHETLQMEIIAVLESLNQLRESPDYELCQISEQKPGVLDELAAERKKLLENESAELETQASRLAEEIKELSGEAADQESIRVPGSPPILRWPARSPRWSGPRAQDPHCPLLPRRILHSPPSPR